MSQSTPQRCKIEISVSGPSREYQSQGSAVTFVPLTIKRRHTRKLLIAPPGQEDAKVRSSFDLPMIRTIGKAFYWQKLLDSGEVANATELADYLVAKGIPFREAHHIVGETVVYAISVKKPLEDLSLPEFQRFSPVVGEDVYPNLELEATLAKRVAKGGVAREQIEAALTAAEAWLAKRAG